MLDSITQKQKSFSNNIVLQHVEKCPAALFLLKIKNHQTTKVSIDLIVKVN
jgi:hypothetical protein